jgi:hypothetical protein
VKRREIIKNSRAILTEGKMVRKKGSKQTRRIRKTKIPEGNVSLL